MTHVITGKARRFKRLAAPTLAAALILGACGGGGSSSSDTTVSAGGDEVLASDLPAVVEGAAQDGGTYGGTLKIAHGLGATSLDPINGSSGFDHSILYPLYDRLVHFDFDSGEAVPGLAESWEYTDPQTLTLSLREGVVFHDGTPFDAEAVAYNIDRVLNHPSSTIKNNLASVESTNVVDELTIEIKTSRPDSSLPLILSDRAGMMVSPTAAEAEPETRLDLKPVGTGPFKLKDYAPGASLAVVRNPDYWQEGLPYLDGIDWSFITETESAVNGVLAGQLNMLAYLSTDATAAELAENPEVVFYNDPGMQLDGCWLNHVAPPFDDVLVRKAWNHAIDREGLADALFFGLAEAAWLPFPEQFWAYDADLVPTFDYDPELAKELLAEAGYPDGIDITMLMYTNPLEDRKAEVIQQAVEPSGFRVEVVSLDGAAANSAMFDDGAAEVYCSGWTGRPDPSQTLTEILTSESYWNYGNTGIDGLDEAVIAGSEVFDQDERAAAYSEAMRIGYNESAWHTVLWMRNAVTISDHSVKGFDQNLSGKAQVQFTWLEE